jgi:hypothetical protein
VVPFRYSIPILPYSEGCNKKTVLSAYTRVLSYGGAKVNLYFSE